MTDPAALLARPPVAEGLSSWMSRQRWFAGPPSAARWFSVTGAPAFAPGGVLAEVRTGAVGDPGGERYVLPLGLAPAAAVPPGVAVIATLDGTSVYDALGDERLVAALIRAMAEDSRAPGLRFRAEGGAFAAPAEPLPVRPLGAEQTNSSVVIGERFILKVFRRPTDGPSSDLTVHRALQRADCPHVTPLLGAIESAATGGTYATLQRYLPEAVDGWELALAGAARFIAGHAGHAGAAGHEGSGGRVGVPGDQRREADALGRALAAVHRELATAEGLTYLRAADYRRLSERFLRRLAEALRTVPQLREHEGWLRQEFTSVAALGDAAALPAQRIHGDLHLGQTLHTEQGWLILDFEGEPLASPEDRDRPDSPLRDLAGMLRSWDYAAHHQLGDRDPLGRAADERAPARAGRWASRHQRAFLDGYARASGRPPAADRSLLRAYQLDKAVYEARYEARHRPGWTWIPLRALRRMWYSQYRETSVLPAPGTSHWTHGRTT